MCFTSLVSRIYGKCPKISYTKIFDKMAYVNSTDPDQTEQSDLDLQYYTEHWVYAILQ